MKKMVPVLLVVLFSVPAFAQVTVTHLTVENLVNPIGIDETHPRFGWQLSHKERNAGQRAYEIKVMEGREEVWKTGKVNSDQSVFIPYEGKVLQSGTRYTWQVRVWDQEGKSSGWSPVAFFQMGMLDPSRWKAQWIESAMTEDTIRRPAQYFRKEFNAAKKIKSATAYFTSHGMYEAQINGQRVGKDYLTPGWTSYNKRLQYQVYDVTPMVKTGANAIGMTVGNGWYRGYLAWENNFNVFGKKLGVFCQLHMVYTDGSEEDIVSDGSWKSAIGPIEYAEIYHGETYDARDEFPGWSSAGFEDGRWAGVVVKDYPKSILVATVNEPVQKHETFSPVKIFRTPKGEQVIDFGQNLVGWVMVKASGNAGTRFSIKHAEVLDKFGNIYLDNMRAAKVTATYVLKGNGTESFEPHFTFFGFRYIMIEGYPGEIKPENFTAVTLYSSMAPTGNFNTSNSLVNQLQHNIQWGQRGNFLDVPTECPQRDERLGWTGDAQAFSRTASFNFGVNNFFSKWLRDVAADQLPNGSVPFVVPNVLGAGASGSAGWADVATIIPWNMYLAYGDRRILEHQYESMKAWVGYMQNNSTGYLWNKGFHFGDWLFYRPFDDNDGRSAVTDKYLITQCFFAHSTQLLINAAKVLGKNEDVAKYENLLQQVKEAFGREYMTPNGRLVSGTQTAYVLALNFDMLPENLRKQAAEKLAENVKSYGNHLTTGFLGTPYLCHVLSRFGYGDLAYSLLLQESYPSWLYPVKMGATTIWERWDGIKPDSTFQTPGMNSFNHYAYGAIGDWMYRVMAGLDTYEDGPGYKHIRIRPLIGGNFDHVKASLNTYYGTVTSAWKKEGGKIIFEMEIPVNTKADVFLPAKNISQVTESGVAADRQSDIHFAGTDQGYLQFKIGSGTYRFEVSGN